MCVINGFQSLRHHAIVGSHHQHDDVCGLRAARPHASEGFVTWRIEENDLTSECWRFLIEDRHFVSADVLRNSSGFTSSDVGETDGI